MPYLRVRIATENPGKHAAQEVATVLTQLAVSDLGKSASAAAVDVQFINPANWFIGGQQLAANQSSFVVEINITAATNTRDAKAKFVQDAFAAMVAQFPHVAKTSYVLLRDVTSEAWGYGGKTQEFRYITGVTD